MASELNHHVGYSRENECWFVRFYPYQTEQQATEAISEFTRPTPVAPVSPDATGKCGELETVLTQSRARRYMEGEGGPWGDWKDGPALTPPPYFQVEERELCDRSQAEELLAAERAKTERWHKKAMDAGVIVHSDGTTSHPMRKERDDLKDDNAANDARVTELEDMLLKRQKRYERRVVDLEAKLTAAEKALEPFANAADGRKSKTVTGSVCFSQHYLLAARAALGGKP